MNQPASPMKSSKALFISDLHLQAGAPKTIAAFQKFLEKKATQAEQLYILGDLFEYWVGDDDMVRKRYKSLSARSARFQTGAQPFSGFPAIGTC